MTRRINRIGDLAEPVEIEPAMPIVQRSMTGGGSSMDEVTLAAAALCLGETFEEDRKIYMYINTLWLDRLRCKTAAELRLAE